MFWNYLDKINRWILIVCNLSVMTIVVAAVVMRYALELNFYGSEEILMIFCILAILFRCRLWFLRKISCGGRFHKCLAR